LLAASLGLVSKPNYDIAQIQHIAIRANETKEAGRLVGEASQEIFLGAFVKVSLLIHKELKIIEL